MPDYRIPDIDGWMGNDEMQWLFDRACEMESIVEIGSWMGRSTHALLSGCKGTVWAVDHFQGNPGQRDGPHARAKTEDIHAIFMANVGNFTNLKVLKMDSAEAAKQFEPKSIDLIFLDGDHDFEAVKKDLLAWMPICKKLLCGHDISEGGVRQALEATGIRIDGEISAIWWSEIK